MSGARSLHLPLRIGGSEGLTHGMDILLVLEIATSGIVAVPVAEVLVDQGLEYVCALCRSDFRCHRNDCSGEPLIGILVVNPLR